MKFSAYIGVSGGGSTRQRSRDTSRPARKSRAIAPPPTGVRVPSRLPHCQRARGSSMAEPEPFRVEILQEELDDLADRLRRTRWPDDFGNDDWSFGVPAVYLRELVDHWLETYDWRAQEEAMNSFEHWRVAIDGLPVHYVLERGRGPDPLPLVLTHGWPWTFWDYRQVIRPLADPGAHGGDPADAF